MEWILLFWITYPNATHKPPGKERLVGKEHDCSNNSGNLGINCQHSRHDRHDSGHTDGRDDEGPSASELFNAIPSAKRSDKKPDLEEPGHQQCKMLTKTNRVLKAMQKMLALPEEIVDGKNAYITVV